ncbi:hypothetical protein SDJN03_07469, partial [Cucurbita argyrosperma subsp. sororia]
MLEYSSSYFRNCGQHFSRHFLIVSLPDDFDLPLSIFSLLVAQFGTSSELLISRSIIFVCFSLSRRFKACFFENLFCCGSSIQDLYLIAN